jgi:prepilin-type processing-associated H-X9-DG protein
MNEHRIGVIYQYTEHADEFRKKTLETLGDYGKCLETTWNKMVIEYNYKQEEVVYRQLFSFHHVTSIRDAHNLAGMQFRNFWFCDGHYEAGVLNYLHSRKRG